MKREQKSKGIIRPGKRKRTLSLEHLRKLQEGANKSRERQKHEQLVKVTLPRRYLINTQSYGPGVVTIPQGLFEMIQETESRIERIEGGINQKRAFVVGASMRKIPVPWDSVETMAGSSASLLLDEISRKGE